MDVVEHDIGVSGSILFDPNPLDGRQDQVLRNLFPVNRGPEVKLAKHAEPQERIGHILVEEGLENVRWEVDMCVSSAPHRECLEHRSMAIECGCWLAAQPQKEAHAADDYLWQLNGYRRVSSDI